MSIALATRGYIQEIRQAVDNVSPYPTVPTAPGGVVASAVQPDTAVPQNVEDVRINASDDSVKVLGGDDSTTIRIIPCDD